MKYDNLLYLHYCQQLITPDHNIIWRSGLFMPLDRAPWPVEGEQLHCRQNGSNLIYSQSVCSMFKKCGRCNCKYSVLHHSFILTAISTPTLPAYGASVYKLIKLWQSIYHVACYRFVFYCLQSWRVMTLIIDHDNAWKVFFLKQTTVNPYLCYLNIFE